MSARLSESKPPGEADSSAVSDATAAIVKSDALKVAEAKEALKTDTSTKKITEALKIDLPAKGSNDTDITWSSSNASVISADGQVTLPAKGIAAVTLTATVKSGEKSDTKEFTFNVWSAEALSDLGTLDELAKRLNTVQHHRRALQTQTSSHTCKTTLQKEASRA